MAFLNTDEPNFSADIHGWTGHFFHTDNLSLMHYTIASDAEPISIHQHPNEEIWNILEGSLEITIDGETKLVGAGDVAMVPANCPHALTPMSAGKAIVVNHPHRLKVSYEDD